ncbi:hypothetical protein TA3x_005438 [Tundrisphaera sp. TA3]|uniref:hypothetical protein n=1 Tax=Tundrisphaera sp. TA3 TaxID=3435775 RepID=UPI003EB7C5FB
MPPSPPARPARRLKKWKRLAAIGLGSFALLIAAFVVALVWTNGFQVTAEGVTAQAARQEMHHRMGLPDTASDVSYLSNVWAFTTVECSISEADFLAWCHERGWVCHPIEPGGFMKFRNGVRNGQLVSIPFDSGLGFSAMDGDFGFGGCFDRDARRASVTFSIR